VLCFAIIGVMVPAARRLRTGSRSSIGPDGVAVVGASSGWLLDGIAVVVCLALGVISVLTLPSLPGYDSFSWVVWGHEIAHHVAGPRLPLIFRGGPSWKPLPVLFTTMFGFFGAAVKLWIAFARGIGLLGLYAAYRLGDRLAASEDWASGGPIAGVLGAIAVVLTSGWVHDMYRATSEPMVITTALLWVEWHFSGRRMAAFWSGVALCLMRPEASVFLLAYALWYLWRSRGILRGIVLLVGLVIVPLGWVLPPWIATGHPLEASSHARIYARGHAAAVHTGLILEVLKRATELTVWPVLIAALVLTVIAVWVRDWVIVTLAGLSLGYVAVVEVMTLAGYPGLERFMLPAVALVCVLAAVGVVRLAALAGGGLTSLAAVSLLVAIAAPAFAGPYQAIPVQHRLAWTAVHSYDDLSVVASQVGGDARIFVCQASSVSINHTAATGFAWALGVPLDRVHGVTSVDKSARHTGLDFFAPRNVVLGGAPAKLVHGLRGKPIHQYRMWRVIRVTRPGDSRANRCVGS
jgi:hypothetical protein